MNNNILKSLFFVTVFYLSAMGSIHADKSEYRSPEHVEGAITTSLQEAKRLYEQGMVFIDVRNPRFYAKGHIPGAFHFDFKYNFDESKLDSVAKKDQPIVIYCSGEKCSRSSRASAEALTWGFSKVHYFRGGISDWKKAGYVIDVGE